MRTLTRHRRTSMLLCIWEAPMGCMVHCSSLRLGCAVCSHLLNVSPLTSLFTVGGPSSHIDVFFLSKFGGFSVRFRSSWLAWAPLWTHPAPDLLKFRKLCEKMTPNEWRLGSLGYPWGSHVSHWGAPCAQHVSNYGFKLRFSRFLKMCVFLFVFNGF